MFISQFILLLILKSCRSNNFDDEEKEASDNVLFYRRFEIIVSNLIIDKNKLNLKCGGSYVGCRLLTDVNIFGISEKRNISLKDEYDETDGIFMVNYAIFDTEDHKKSEYFEKVNTLKIMTKTFNEVTKTETVYFSATYNNMIQTHSNTERRIKIYFSEITQMNSTPVKESFGIFLSYHCKGYTGINCQFKCYSRTSNIECDYTTGKKYCSNPKYNNPPLCNLLNKSCPINEFICRNGGNCVKIYQDHYMCECVDGWKGLKCEEFYCETPCDINYGTCVGPNECKCSVGYKTGKYCNETQCNTDDSQCLNGAMCSVYGNEIFCSCNQEKYAGKYCEKQCSPDCVYGICTFLNETTFCHCLKGFRGKACNEILQEPKPIFSKYYISPKNQKIAFVTLFFITLAATVFSCGIGGYIRNNIKRNIEVVKRTNATLSEITYT